MKWTPAEDKKLLKAVGKYGLTQGCCMVDGRTYYACHTRYYKLRKAEQDEYVRINSTPIPDCIKPDMPDSFYGIDKPHTTGRNASQLVDTRPYTITGEKSVRHEIVVTSLSWRNVVFTSLWFALGLLIGLAVG